MNPGVMAALNAAMTANNRQAVPPSPHWCVEIVGDFGTMLLRVPWRKGERPTYEQDIGLASRFQTREDAEGVAEYVAKHYPAVRSARAVDVSNTPPPDAASGNGKEG